MQPNRFEQAFARCPLPESVAEIAEVIGEAKALALLSQLPLVAVSDKRQQAPRFKRSIYVPRHLQPEHPLVAMIGWESAAALSARYACELLQPALCHERFLRFRREVVLALQATGMPLPAVALVVGISTRNLRRLCFVPVARAERATGAQGISINQLGAMPGKEM